MLLPPEETTRFYRIWFPLLHYVNGRLQLVPPWPAIPGEGTVPTEHALQVRDALWADDSLRDQFVADNPAGLPAADLEVVASWRHRCTGAFYILRSLKAHTIFLSDAAPPHAYGVLGLISPFEEIVGPHLPVLVQAVLLPFAGRITYDSLLRPYRITFGPGTRRRLNETYREAQEREGVITTLVPPAAPASPAAVRADVRQRTGKVLAAFRRELARTGLNPRTVEQHVATVEAFAYGHLLDQEPPRGLLDLSRGDLHEYLTTTGRAANRVSFRRLVRFLTNTGRLDYDVAVDLADYLRNA